MDTGDPVQVDCTVANDMSPEHAYRQLPGLHPGDTPLMMNGAMPPTDAYGNQLPTEQDVRNYQAANAAAMMYMSPLNIAMTTLPFSPTMTEQGYGFNGAPSEMGSPLMQHHNPYDFLMSDALALHQQQPDFGPNGSSSTGQSHDAASPAQHGGNPGRRSFNYGNNLGGVGGGSARGGGMNRGGQANGFYGFQQDSRQPFWVNYQDMYAPGQKPDDNSLHIDRHGNLRGDLAPPHAGPRMANNGFRSYQSNHSASSRPGGAGPHLHVGFGSPRNQRGIKPAAPGSLYGPFGAFSHFGMSPRPLPRTRFVPDVQVPRSALLEEFKADKQTKRWETVNIFGHLNEFAGDQYGSRLVQQKLQQATPEDRERIFEEIMPNAYAVMTDVFGNYVVQKMFEQGDQAQKARLAKEMEGKMLTLSMQMYGCRVVQKALEHVLADQRERMMAELEGHIVDCVKSNNANHVVQRMVSLNPPQSLPDSFLGVVEELSVHPYGCRVLQKIFECLPDDMTRQLLEELHDCTDRLITDQFGSGFLLHIGHSVFDTALKRADYVVQSVITHGSEPDRAKVIAKMKARMVELSRHKFASNVVEKAIVHSSTDDRRDLINALIGLNPDGSSNVGMLLRDAFGNFPVQTALMTGERDQRQQLFDIIHPLVPALRQSPVGKRLERKLDDMVQKEDFVAPARSGTSRRGSAHPTRSGAASESGKLTSSTEDGTEVGTSTDMSRSGSNDTAVTTPEQRCVPLVKTAAGDDHHSLHHCAVYNGERLTRSLSATTPIPTPASLLPDGQHNKPETFNGRSRSRDSRLAPLIHGEEGHPNGGFRTNNGEYRDEADLMALLNL